MAIQRLIGYSAPERGKRGLRKRLWFFVSSTENGATLSHSVAVAEQLDAPSDGTESSRAILDGPRWLNQFLNKLNSN